METSLTIAANLQEAVGQGQPCLENNSKVPDGEDTEDCEGFYPNE